MRTLLLLVGLLINLSASVSEEDYVLMPPLFHVDDYDRCMANKESSLYCSFVYQLEPIDRLNVTDIWRVVEKVSSNTRNYRHDLLRHKLCVEETCPRANFAEKLLHHRITQCYDKRFKQFGVKGTVTELKCVTADTRYDLGSVDVIVAILAMFYVSFVIFATIYEGFARYKTRKEYEEFIRTRIGWFLCAFSLVNNYFRLTAKNNNADHKKLQSIQGIRFYNMILVILTHTLMYWFRGPVLNPEYIENAPDRFLNMILINGHFGVQTFFIISGWLLTFHFFQMFEKIKVMDGKIIHMAIFNRITRLLPTLMVVLAVHSTWLVQLGNGPLWDEMVAEDYANCRKYWWTNVLFINNLVYADKMCLQQTWYLAADMQLFLITLFILAFISKHRKLTKYIFGLCHLIGILIVGSLAYFYEYDAVLRQYPEAMYKFRNIKRPLWTQMFAATYTNIGGWMVGVTFGYLFYLYKDVQLFTKKRFVVLWWILVWGLSLGVIFTGIIFYDENYQYNPLHSALYWSLSKPIFSLGIAMGIFGFSQGIGWFMRSFCEWGAVEVLGRLTYSAYLVHSVFITYRAGIGRTPIYSHDSLIIFTGISDVCVSYMAALFLCLFVEMPISALQKAFLPQVSHASSKTKLNSD